MPTIGTFFLSEDLREEGSGRYTGVGIFAGEARFSTIEDASFDKLFLFVSLQDIEAGEHEISFDIDHLSLSKNLKVGSDTINVESKSDIAFIARIDGFAFPGPGDFQINFHVDGERLGALAFAIKVDEQQDSSSE